MFPSVNEQMDVIRSGAVDVLPEDELIKKIENSIQKNKPLIVKLGCDPSKPDLHIGHAVVLYKMRQFQDLGHTAVLIIGDFTAMIGDPSGKSKTRPQLSLEETRINGQTYLEQATKVLSKNNLIVRYNSEWLSKMNFNEVIHLASKYTVAQLLERDDFSKRYKSGEPISIHELLYPLAQAMDSVAIEADIELGGTDQKFNLIVGREIQKAYNKEPQCIITLPILEGTDGKEKMSKSLNNYIALTDPPNEMFGKIMSIPDELIIRYYQYGAHKSEEEVKKFENDLKTGKIHPRDAKALTAVEIIKQYYDEHLAISAKEEFDRIFREHQLPDKIDEFHLDRNESLIITDILHKLGLVPSKKEAKRLIESGAVAIDGEKITDIFYTIKPPFNKVIKVGKRKFVKVIVE